MTRHWKSETALLKAFELAQHLCPQRSVALAVTARAWAVLDVAVAVQDKRLYYRPRPQSGERGPLRSKVVLSEVHLLQRLVCAEAEKSASADGQTGFTAIFLAAVVRRALERNSFYTALAVTRVLHDYSTREGMLLYTGLVHDPQRVRSEDYWRSRKRLLLSEVLQRHRDRLELCRGVHGEERFAVVDNVGPLIPLVHETLTALTPWDTPCVVPEKLDSFLGGIPQLAWSGDAAENDREVQRMHALVHPSCFQRLTSAAGLEAPAAHLAIPRLLCSKGDDEDAERRPPAPLDGHEREALLAELNGLSRRRRRGPNVCLSVLVNGVERGRIEPQRDATCRIAVDAEATRLEVVTSDLPGSDPLLLAWLPLEREAATDALRPLRRRLTLEGGQRLTFVVTPGPADNPSLLPTAEILVRYQETAIARCLALGLRRLRGRMGAGVRWPILRPIAVSLAVFGLAVLMFRANPWSMPTQMPAISPSPAGIPPAQSRPFPPPQARRLDGDARPSSDGPTRSLTPRPVGVGLAEVRVLWLNVAAAGLTDRAVAQRMEDQLIASGFAFGKRPEEADAAIEIELLRPLAAENTDDVSVHWRLRVVNAAGAVLWPTSGSARDYRGPLSRGAVQMARELSAAVALARESQARRSGRP